MAAGACLALGGVAGLAPASAQAQTPVTLRVDVFFYGSHVPMLYGIVDGIYKKHGLDVTAQTGRGSATTIQTVANVSDQFGFADGGTLVRLAAQGVRAKHVVGILQLNPMMVIAMPGSGVNAPKDLNGRTGGFSPGSSPEQLFPAFAKKVGIDLNTIKRVSVDIPTRDNIFVAKQTEFSFGYLVTQLPLIQERCSCTLTVMRYADHGMTAVSNGITVSDKYAAENPDVVRRFARATVESIDAAMKNEARAIDAFFEYAKGTQLSRNVITQQWQQTTKLLRTEATANKPLGVMDEGDWQKSIDLLVEYADVPKGAVTPGMVYTNQYLVQ